MVLVNTNAASWAPMKWTYDSLLKTLGKDRKVRLQVLKEPTMVLYRHFAEYGVWPGTEQDYSTEEYTLGKVIEELKRSRTQKKQQKNQEEEEEVFLYAPQEITETFSPTLYNEIQPTGFFNVKPSAGKQHVTLWLQSRGVTTQIHFDLDENFHLQILGNKRFLLVPPSQHEKLYLYPRIHPSYRRSQADLEAVDLERYPRFAEVEGALEVTLKPGDMLYIPPLWFHHVTNVNAGLSINVFSDSDELGFWDDSQKSLPAFKAMPNPELRIVVGMKFISGLLRELEYPITPMTLTTLDSFKTWLEIQRSQSPRRTELAW